MTFKEKTYELMQNLGLEPMDEKTCNKLWANVTRPLTEDQIKDEIFDICERLRITGSTMTNVAAAAQRFDEAFEANHCGEIDICYEGDNGLVWLIDIYHTEEAKEFLNNLQDEMEA